MTKFIQIKDGLRLNPEAIEYYDAADDFMGEKRCVIKFAGDAQATKWKFAAEDLDAHLLNPDPLDNLEVATNWFLIEGFPDYAISQDWDVKDLHSEKIIPWCMIDHETESAVSLRKSWLNTTDQTFRITMNDMGKLIKNNG